jgi:universal stress protein A
VLEIKRILAPTDFSPHAEAALRFACSLAERVGSTLHLLHILPEVVPVGPDPMLAPTLPPEYYTETETQSLDALSKAIDPTWGHAPHLEVAVRWGDAVEGIVGYARDVSIDLIVIATHGRTGLKHVLLGSVAERIVREAPCPVLSIRTKT